MPKLNQEQLLTIFNALKSQVAPYERGSIKARINIEGKYDLWSEKTGIVVNGKPRTEISFVTLILQSSYVGFYYMPIYSEGCDLREKIAPGLMKMLKGKACFHIKTVDEDILAWVKDAMKLGFEAFKTQGWVA